MRLSCHPVQVHCFTHVVNFPHAHANTAHSHTAPCRYYAYIAENTAPFSVIVTPMGGDPDLYVDTRYLPNRTNYQWYSDSQFTEVS